MHESKNKKLRSQDQKGKHFVLAKPFAIKMGDQKQLDVESQMEIIPLYPQLTEGQQQLQSPRDDVDGNKITQADLDRYYDFQKISCFTMPLLLQLL